jgi:hypothetical protein
MLLIRAAKTDAVMTLAVLYAVFLLWNTATALRRGGRVFAAGLVLLILCDVNVALWNLPSPPILPALRAFAGTGMWLFLPSLSGFRRLFGGPAGQILRNGHKIARNKIFKKNTTIFILYAL